MKKSSFLVMLMLIMIVSACSGDENQKAENKVSTSGKDDRENKEQSNEENGTNKEDGKVDSAGSSKEEDKKFKSHPVPEYVDKIRQKVEFWIPKDEVKSAFSEPHFSLEIGDEKGEDYDSDFIYYFTEDGSKFEGISDIQKENAVEKGKELVKSGYIQVVVKFSFSNENEKIESITMYKMENFSTTMKPMIWSQKAFLKKKDKNL